jgi:hypothetical protein
MKGNVVDQSLCFVDGHDRGCYPISDLEHVILQSMTSELDLKKPKQNVDLKIIQSGNKE